MEDEFYKNMALAYGFIAMVGDEIKSINNDEISETERLSKKINGHGLFCR